ncbi:MAG TPA: hypothetical protein VEA19_00590 [Actinomycetota bacterium]|nr:hypothetical protein [Actinomycetota bacterium]
MAVAAQRLETALPARAPLRLPARRARRIPFAMLSMAVVAAMLLGLVTAQTLVTQNSFRLAELSSRAEELERGFGRLRLRAAELSSPERLQKAAKKAGMVLPERVELVEVPAVRGASRHPATGTLALKGVLGGGG